jgi:uncharacterized protein
MKISGAYTLAVFQERAFALLQNPEVLARAMPGCESLDRVGDNEYVMKMKMVLASMSGLFEGRVRISDFNPPSSFRLIVEGKGKIGFMRGEGLLTLTPAGSGSGSGSDSVMGSSSGPGSGSSSGFGSAMGCHVQYEGDVQVGGTIAAVGQRLLDTTSRLLIKRFFEKLNGEASAVAHFVA